MQDGLTNLQISASPAVQTLFNEYFEVAPNWRYFNIAFFLFFPFSLLLSFLFFSFFFWHRQKPRWFTFSRFHSLCPPLFFAAYNYDARGRIGRESDRTGRERGGGGRESKVGMMRGGQREGGRKKMSPSRECESAREQFSGWRSQTAPHRGGYYRSWGIVTLRVRPCAYGIRTSVTATVVRRWERHIRHRHCHRHCHHCHRRLHRLSLTSNVLSRNANLWCNNSLSNRPVHQPS